MLVAFKAEKRFEAARVISCLVSKNGKAAEKFISVSLTAFPKSQSVGSSAVAFDAWRIFTYWKFLTPTYFAKMVAGTSKTDSH